MTNQLSCPRAWLKLWGKGDNTMDTLQADCTGDRNIDAFGDRVRVTENLLLNNSVAESSRKPSICFIFSV